MKPGLWFKTEQTDKKHECFCFYKILCFFGYHHKPKVECYNGLGDSTRACTHCGESRTIFLVWPDPENPQ